MRKEPRVVELRFELGLAYLRAPAAARRARELLDAQRLDPREPRIDEALQASLPKRRRYALRHVPARRSSPAGPGFIGSHLSELLLADGWEVFVLDDVSTGSLDNVAHLRDRPDYHLVVDSVLSPGGRQRARAQVRRRLPPRGGRRRAPDRRAAGAHDGHQRPGHRDRARLLQPASASAC